MAHLGDALLEAGILGRQLPVLFPLLPIELWIVELHAVQRWPHGRLLVTLMEHRHRVRGRSWRRTLQRLRRQGGNGKSTEGRSRKQQTHPCSPQRSHDDSPWHAAEAAFGRACAAVRERSSRAAGTVSFTGLAVLCRCGSALRFCTCGRTWESWPLPWPSAPAERSMASA